MPLYRRIAVAPTMYSGDALFHWVCGWYVINTVRLEYKGELGDVATADNEIIAAAKSKNPARSWSR